MTQQGPTPPRHRGRLSDTLVTLAATPDDHSGVDDQLVTIAQLSAHRVAAISYASVTARSRGAYTTVAASDDIALAVDQAQYADQTGPCLDALDTARPHPVPDMAATMRWPGFRDTAYRLGLHASLSIPLFAGRGGVIAALNLYSHDPATMAALTGAVLATYDDRATRAGLDLAGLDLAGLDEGGAELVAGLTDAFAVRATIQRAIGVIIAEQGSAPDQAYATLRLRAVDTGCSLPDTAETVIAGDR